MRSSDPVAPDVVFDEQGREVLGWPEFGEVSRWLGKQVLDSGFTPEVVIAIARGGLLLAGSISYAMGVKACGALNVEFYTEMEKTLPEPVVLPPMLDGGALAGKRVLLVDDVSDSGRTLHLVRELLAEMGAEVRTVCLYVKPRTILRPDFVWRETDAWIAFPWSALPPVNAGADTAVDG
ncbi:phosphoribosyltransferase [Gryllotalpicola ginsengisoli]|uniref:phosphoribosyltransferase n=1 Tax=Gryllotalpicola ginsengisoli TaxID=444608 RepID=UPI0003B60E33|nr:phosphoribosyltransferase [Gryllotalpicola ginsengisoli]